MSLTIEHSKFKLTFLVFLIGIHVFQSWKLVHKKTSRCTSICKSALADYDTANSPIRLVDFSIFKDLGHIPRFPDSRELTTNLDDVDRKNSFIVFISHCWLRGWSGAKDWSGRPHPDSVRNEKYNLCVQGIEKAKIALAPGMEKCFIWLDFSCIDQDGDPAGELKQLDQIVRASDCIFTPIVDSEEWELPSNIGSWFEAYRSKGWRGGPHAYLNRGWCRVEMFYAANIPTGSDKELEKQRQKQFAAGLRFHASEGRRPHLLYGSHELRKQWNPIVLPPLRNSYFHKYHPASGQLSFASDQPVIERLVTELYPYMTFVQEGYEGERNEKGKMHGQGVYHYHNGAVYNGEYKDDKRDGVGTHRFANGAVFQGEFRENLRHGTGVYMAADGSSYTGTFKKGRKHCHGTQQYASGDAYVGEYKNGRMHGTGSYSSREGTYTGDFKDDAMHGRGECAFANGESYTGEYKHGQAHGKGVFKYADGTVFRGHFKDGAMQGRGEYIDPSGQVFRGEHKGDTWVGPGTGEVPQLADGNNGVGSRYRRCFQVTMGDVNEAL